MILQLLLEAETTHAQRLLHVQQKLIDELPDELEVDVNHEYKREPPMLLITGTLPGASEQLTPLIVRVPMPGETAWAFSEITITRSAGGSGKRELRFTFPKELDEMITCIVKDNFDIWRDRWV